MRVGVLVEDRVALWQRRAIERIAPNHELYRLRAANPCRSPRALNHLLYYALNLLTIRNKMTRRMPVPASLFVESFDFSPTSEGAWARLPAELLAWVREKKLDAIVKFGLGLVRIPSKDDLSIPIMSFHHGDPREFRGRPAGFYELLQGKPYLGQIVQVLGDNVDRGQVYAFAQTLALPHSYKRTLVESYRLSPYLLPVALDNVRTNARLAIEPTGRNYRLPSNALVIKFVLGRAWNALRRLAYGAFVEKRWNIAIAEIGEASGPVEAVRGVTGAEWRTPAVDRPYSFYADGFFHSGPDDILVEAMNARTGKGEIVRIRNGKPQPIGGFRGHVSYPASFEEAGQRYLIPEMASIGKPRIYQLGDDRAREVAVLDIDDEAILDPTFVRRGNHVFLFGNLAQEGASVLHLWVASSLFGRFERHPKSPIRLSSRGSRMAGEVTEWAGQLYRIGQDVRSGYGDGILAYRIVAMDASDYVEEEAGTAAFDHVKGPHTVNIRSNVLLFDWYTNRFSLLAGARRVLNWL